MKTLRLPNIKPTSRTYTPGVIAETVFEAQNGATSFVRFGHFPIKTKLSLSYQNIDEAQAFRFIEVYNRCIVEDKGIHINENDGAVKDIDDDMDMGDEVRGVDNGLIYRFEKPPAVQAVLSGRYNLNIDLVGTLIA